MSRKSHAQLDREIAEALGRTPRMQVTRTHSTKLPDPWLPRSKEDLQEITSTAGLMEIAAAVTRELKKSGMTWGDTSRARGRNVRIWSSGTSIRFEVPSRYQGHPSDAQAIVELILVGPERSLTTVGPFAGDQHYDKRFGEAMEQRVRQVLKTLKAGSTKTSAGARSHATTKEVTPAKFTASIRLKGAPAAMQTREFKHRAEAQAWLDQQREIADRRGWGGYVFELTEQGEIKRKGRSGSRSHATVEAGRAKETPALMTYARKLGLKTYVENGRIKVEGTNAIGKMKKIWAAIGADVELDHDGPKSKSWTAKIDGELVGTILHDKSNSFTYSYSVA